MKKYKVLWLLHGTYGDYSDWVRKTNVELYAYQRKIAVVMPSASNSNYADWDCFALGYKVYSYFTEELMPMIYASFPIGWGAAMVLLLIYAGIVVKKMWRDAEAEGDAPPGEAQAV